MHIFLHFINKKFRIKPLDRYYAWKIIDVKYFANVQIARNPWSTWTFPMQYVRTNRVARLPRGYRAASTFSRSIDGDCADFCPARTRVNRCIDTNTTQYRADETVRMHPRGNRPVWTRPKNTIMYSILKTHLYVKYSCVISQVWLMSILYDWFFLNKIDTNQLFVNNRDFLHNNINDFFFNSEISFKNTILCIV